MLEAMQERQVSIGGAKYKMPEPFIVLATENPIEQEGTYELPEAQLDRFLLKIMVPYPKREDELKILDYTLNNQTSAELPPELKVSLDEIKALQAKTKQIKVDDSIKNYIVNIITATRNPKAVIDPSLAKYVEFGASPRGAIALLRVSQALALIHGRDYVTPDEVHAEAIIDAIFSKVTAP